MARQISKMVTEKQLADETYQVTATDVVADERNRPMVIVCDRGILDGAAYVGDRDVFLKQFGLNLNDCFELYDKVIHLNSVAVDDPQKYEELKATNPSRFEDADEATKLDNALFAVYEGHPNHIRVGAGEGIETKIETVFQEIETMLESTEHQEPGSIESPETT